MWRMGIPLTCDFLHTVGTPLPLCILYDYDYIVCI